jgi:hypothetical protein
METDDKTAEWLEMAAVMQGNRTLAADDIDSCVSKIDGLSKWHGANIYPVILNCCHRVVASLVCHVVEPYSLSLVEILWLTCSVKQRSW